MLPVSQRQTVSIKPSRAEKRQVAPLVAKRISVANMVVMAQE